MPMGRICPSDMAFAWTSAINCVVYKGGGGVELQGMTVGQFFLKWFWGPNKQTMYHLVSDCQYGPPQALDTLVCCVASLPALPHMI